MSEALGSKAYAILCWGVDLGPEQGTAAQLFEGHYISDENKQGSWMVAEYGSDGQYRAIVLNRAAEYMQENAGDKDVSHWFSGAVTASGVNLDSAPTATEISSLTTLLDKYSTPDEQKKYKLGVLGAQLLPGCAEAEVSG